MTRPVRAPRHLSPAHRLFADVVSIYVLEPHHVQLFTKALEAFDRAEQARAILDSPLGDANDPTAALGGGLLVRSRLGEWKPHPLLAAERDARAQFFAGIKQLGLDLEGPPPPSARR